MNTLESIMKRAMIKNFDTPKNYYFGEFHTVGKQEKSTFLLTKIIRK
jgi:hypothetical protein